MIDELPEIAFIPHSDCRKSSPKYEKSCILHGYVHVRKDLSKKSLSEHIITVFMRSQYHASIS